MRATHPIRNALYATVFVLRIYLDTKYSYYMFFGVFLGDTG